LFNRLSAGALIIRVEKQSWQRTYGVTACTNGLNRDGFTHTCLAYRYNSFVDYDDFPYRNAELAADTWRDCMHRRPKPRWLHAHVYRRQNTILSLTLMRRNSGQDDA
jgi:hypothetical protein